ncbi:type IV secretion protein Rhs [Leptospira semungkisensis]|uniref:Type IV secretion protein Rhs n=1 Tax=Leptospira semungkisensis TaxID=2484985 RepID=A0A4R9G7P5_9LEPT|nr:RHS repeat-associated core domain-containing protein [Leptospira semungkisensis]TGK07513.1 type IV secretion protein Rhs [Leptospira semungkisensis]
MLNLYRTRILSFSVIILSSFLLLAWNPLKPILNYFAAAFTGGETSIPLPLPNVQIGVSGKPSFSLSIQAPPGAGDMVPSITIDYSNGNQSIVGKGWGLGGFPRILKNPNLGVHFGSSDGFSSSLLGELISTGSSGVYRTKIESFYKATFDGTAWTLRDPSGVTYEYGRNSASGSNSIVQGESGPVTLYLDRVRDRFGNGYDITYASDTLNSDEPLPQEIKYARGNARIEFIYSDRPSGWKEQAFYLTNSGIRKKLLSQIQAYANDANGSEQLVDTYNLDFDSSSELGPLLSSFERENYKPIVFNYTERTNQANILSSSSKNFDLSYKAKDSANQANCTATQNACLCSANYACLVASWFTAGGLCASGIAAYQDICTNGVTTSFVTPADTNGDGVPEIVRVNGTMTNQKFSVTPLSNWEAASGNSLSASNTLVGSHIGITLNGRILPGDYNADGKSDFLVLTDNGDPLKVYYGPDFSSTTYSSVTALGLTSSASNTTIKQFVADMNGDGKTDYIQADSSNNLVVYTSTGSGFQKLQTLSIPTFGTEFQQLVDFDGNGVPDFVRINSGTSSKDLLVTFLDFQNGALQILETSKVSRTDFGKTGDQFITDINGDGYPDFAFFAMSGTQGTVSYYPFNGRNFITSGASPLQTINVNKAYARQVAGSTSNVTYVNVDLSGDSVKDQVSYDSSNVSNPFFNVQIYSNSQSKYLTAIQVPWNQNVSSDLNGDGIADTIRADSNTTQQTDASGNTTTQTVTEFQVTITNGSYFEVPIDLNSYITASTGSSDASSMGYSNWRNPKDFVDLNQDGKPDFVRYDAASSTLYVSYAKLDSNGYITYSASGDDSWSTGGYLMALDANGDGKPEILGMNANQVNLITTIQSSAPTVRTNVVRTFPYESNVQLHYIRFNQDLPSGLLTTIQNGATSSSGDLTLGIEYQLAKNHSGAIQPSLYDSSKPQFIPFTGADYLATRLTQKVGDTLLSAKNCLFSYSRFYLNGFRNSSYIGFQTVTQTDEISNEVVVSSYNPSFIEMAGVATSQTKYKNGIKISETTNTFAKSTSILGGILVLPGDSSETQYQGGQVLTTTQVSKAYDSYGHVSTKNTSINGSVLTETTSYLNDWNSGVLDKPADIQVSKDGELVSHKQINYSNFQVSEVKGMVSNGVWKSQFIQAYDTYGNPSVTKDSNGNVNTIEYDTVVHKYPVKVTNSLGHVLQKSYDLTNGMELSTTDPNGGVSKTEYDKFNRAVFSYMPGETDWSEKIEYENTGDIENQLVRKTFRRSDGESWQEESSNVLTGLSKKRSSLINGYVLVEETNTNREGQKIKEIDPYIEGSNPISWTTFSYDAEGALTGSSSNNGRSVVIQKDGLNTTTQDLLNGNIIKQTVENKNSIGQVVSLTQQGKTIGYKYSANGKTSQIIDPENGTTYIQTNLSGNQTQVIHPDSGTTTFSYDPVTGNLSGQTFANGASSQYSYDALGRVVQEKATDPQGITEIHSFEYDSTSAANAIGRLSKATDPLGSTEFGYDIRGNQTILKKTLTDESLTFLVQKSYNLQNQVEQVTYPDGSIAKNIYSEAGYLSGVTLTPADGSGSDFPIVQYAGPTFEDNLLKIQRILGNGVKTDITFDPLQQRLVGLKTGIDSSVYQDNQYSYDASGNYQAIADKKNPVRNQNFMYDTIDRLSSAAGVYGSETYQYSDSGKLLQKGNITYTYGDPSHKNAVTQVNNNGTIYTYAYDASGNVVNRNGNAFSYNPFQKLKSMQTDGGDTVTFDYDFTGTRIRKTKTSDGLKTISLGGLYEVVLAPSKSPQHTLYFRGNSGDLVGQWTRTDATLVSDASSIHSGSSTANVAWNTFVWQSKDIGIRGMKLLFLSPKVNFAFLYVSLFLGLGFVLLSWGDGIWKATLKFTTPILLLSFANCSVLLPGGNGTSPWTLLPVINSGTPGVSDPGSGAGIPISGFIFLHPDHLGSIVMATDGNGNRVTGGEQAGASFVSYKPYGEINRTDSAGPDVFRYKYTGQEEDKETGLYYYKARYYDPILGRFLQADDQINGSSPMGNDVYMYTEGNPIKYTDPTGHSVFSSWLSKNGLGFLNFNIVISAALQRAFYVSSARWNAIGAIAAILNPVGLIANAIGGGVFAGATATIGAATMLGLAAAGGIIGAASAVLGANAVMIAGAIGAGVIGTSAVVGASSLGQLSAVAGALGIGAAGLASALAFTAGATALVAGLFALAVASFLVITALATALATAFVAISLIPVIAVATALGIAGAAAVVGVMAIGSILSLWTLQAYIGGGYSKSSINNIHWDEESARKGACYAAAGQLGGMLAGAGLYGYPILVAQMQWLPMALNIYGVASTIKSIISKDWKSVGADTLGYAIKFYYDKDIPFGLILKYGEGTNRTCGSIR